MLKLIDKLFFPQPAVEMTQGRIREGEFKENPKVVELREKAKAKMEEWGRKSLLDGGEFSLNNTVLKRS